MKELYSAGIIVYAKQDSRIEYLLLHYPVGHWGFPKGKIEKGETNQEAALRELYEETGLHAELKPGFEEQFSYFLHDLDGNRVHKTVYFFVGETEIQDISLSHEHQDYDWLPFNVALKQLTYDNAKEVLRKAHAFISEGY